MANKAIPSVIAERASNGETILFKGRAYGQVISVGLKKPRKGLKSPTLTDKFIRNTRCDSRLLAVSFKAENKISNVVADPADLDFYLGNTDIENTMVDAKLLFVLLYGKDKNLELQDDYYYFIWRDDKGNLRHTYELPSNMVRKCEAIVNLQDLENDFDLVSDWLEGNSMLTLDVLWNGGERTHNIICYHKQDESWEEGASYFDEVIEGLEEISKEEFMAILRG